MAAAEALEEEEEMVGRSVGWVVGWMEAGKERREGNNQGANESERGCVIQHLPSALPSFPAKQPSPESTESV